MTIAPLLAAAIAVNAAPAAPRPADFPPVERLLGAAEDPLARLAFHEEGLRDAVAASPAPSLPAALRSPDPAERLAAVDAAGAPRRRESVPHLRGVLMRLDERPSIRAAAAVALGRIGDASASGALLEALRDPAEEVRYAAALALGRLAVDGAASRLTRTLSSDPSWWVRYAAAAALGRTRRPFAAASLEDCLRREARWQVRLQAVRSLQDIAGPRAARALETGLRDADPGVRAAAALALAEVGEDDQLPALRVALRAETDPSNKPLLAAAFRRILSRR
jgi:HEAT repeat protein